MVCIVGLVVIEDCDWISYHLPPATRSPSKGSPTTQDNVLNILLGKNFSPSAPCSGRDSRDGNKLCGHLHTMEIIWSKVSQTYLFVDTFIRLLCSFHFISRWQARINRYSLNSRCPRSSPIPGRHSDGLLWATDMRTEDIHVEILLPIRYYYY